MTIKDLSERYDDKEAFRVYEECKVPEEDWTNLNGIEPEEEEEMGWEKVEMYANRKPVREDVIEIAYFIKDRSDREMQVEPKDIEDVLKAMKDNAALITPAIIVRNEEMRSCKVYTGEKSFDKWFVVLKELDKDLERKLKNSFDAEPNKWIEIEPISKEESIQKTGR